MTTSISRLRAGIVYFAMMVSAGGSAFAAPAINAVPPAAYLARGVAKAAPAALLLAPDSPAWRIALPAPTTAEKALLKSRNQRSTGSAGQSTQEKRALAIAYPRAVPSASRSVALDRLAWQTLPDGSRAARVQIVSPGASALRVALTLPPIDTGVVVRFAGSGEPAQVFGPIPANAIAGDTLRYGRFWSPVLAGDTATLELQAEAGVRVTGVVLGVVQVSHQVPAPGELRKMGAKTASNIGSSGSCEIDVACVTPQTQALIDSDKAVAEMEFTQEDGFSYLCTGQLLNDSLSSNTPYFFSANHCLNSALAAHTLNTFWFFDAVACGDDKTVPPYVQQTAGAALLARSEDWDWALVRLNAPPPAGARFAAWRAEPIPSGAVATVIHHPQGDLKKWSQGSMQGYQLYTDGSSFAQVQYGLGTTEPGSSGAGLLTYFSGGGYYEVRGGLWQGAASCSDPAGIDEYSRLENMLPLTRQFLTPDADNPTGLAAAVEFYNQGLDHYFISTSPAEINDLDTGVHPGWERTGLSFLAYNNPAPGTNPVCRFYRTPGFGDSHFYSASPAECQAVIDNPQAYPGWTYESPNVFYIALPNTATGACASGTLPIWRFYNQVTVNHRYTADHTLRDLMRADPVTWIPEGYGPNAVIMCAPAGS